MREIVEAALAESAESLKTLRSNSTTLDAIARAGVLLSNSLQGGSRL